MAIETIIYQEIGKIRLDKLLIQHLTSYTRSQIQKLIKNGQIKVNDKTVLPHYFLKTSDKIVIELKPKDFGESSQVADKPTIAQKPEIIAETADYLIINKPAGLIVHPTESIKDNTLADWLIKKYPEIKNVGDDPQRPGLVHRLDKDVSGLMVIAKNQRMFEHLKNQFQTRQIKKEYLGLVYGQIKADEGQIDFPLSRSKVTGKIVAKPKESEGKAALTKFEVIGRFRTYTLLKIFLLTGRTHQIRAHLQAYGHPIVCDKLYNSSRLKDKLKIKRIFLHAAHLGFFDLNNDWHDYQSDLPTDLKNILTTLK